MEDLLCSMWFCDDSSFNVTPYPTAALSGSDLKSHITLLTFQKSLHSRHESEGVIPLLLVRLHGLLMESDRKAQLVAIRTCLPLPWCGGCGVLALAGPAQVSVCVYVWWGSRGCCGVNTFLSEAVALLKAAGVG